MSWITGGGGGGNTAEAKSYTDTQVNILKDGVDSTGDTLKKLRDLITAIQTLLNSNDANLDTLQEVVTYIKSNATVLEGVTISKVNVSDIIDDLVHTDVNKPLSANQGKALKALIDALTTTVNAKGDMSKDIYDTDGDGKVDKSVQADNATKVNNHTASATPTTTEQIDLVGMVNEVIAKRYINSGYVPFSTGASTTQDVIIPFSSFTLGGFDYEGMISLELVNCVYAGSGQTNFYTNYSTKITINQLGWSSSTSLKIFTPTITTSGDITFTVNSITLDNNKNLKLNITTSNSWGGTGGDTKITWFINTIFRS